MIRLAWRQFRLQAIVALGMLTIASVVLVITGFDLSHIFNATVATCKSRAECSPARSAFLSHYQLLQNLGHFVILLPVFIGMFWGAPLIAREAETGTYRMAWTQSVTRVRWLAAKIGIVGLASVVVAGEFSLVVTWWFSPIDRVDGNLFGLLDERALVPIGYTAFAFALGVTCGMLIRRTLPAMVTTLVAFIGVRLALTDLRPNFISPMHRTMGLNPDSIGYGGPDAGSAILIPAPANIPNGWEYSTQIVNRTGQALTSQIVKGVCPRLGTGSPPSSTGNAVVFPQGFHTCVTKLSATYHELLTFQPASRYWSFQWHETAIYAAMALVLVGFCCLWIRHRFA